MGKKNLTKSTTKKKSAATKKKTKSASTTTKAAPKKKAASKKKAGPKAKATPKKAAAKKKTTAKKKPTLKSLIKKDFGSWSPETLFAVTPDEDYLNNFTAPPVIDKMDKAKAEKIKSLLAKQFDLNAVEKPPKAQKTAPKKAEAKKATPKKKAPAAKPTPKKMPPAEKKAVSIPELLRLKFESWQPGKMYAASTDEEFQKGFTAPPAIDTADKAEADRIKVLLAKTFDLTVSEPSDVPPAAEPVMPKTKEPEKVKAEEVTEAPQAEPVKEETKKATPKPEPKKTKPEVKKETPKKPEKPVAPPAPPVIPEVSEPTEPPMGNALKMLIAIIGGLFGLLVIASAMNTNNYYLKSSDNAIEIWKGNFSPTGRKMIISLPDATIEKPIKSVYVKKEALVPVFNYYINKAEALSEVKGMLDFESIKSNLYKAIKFAPTSQHQKKAKTRLNKIDFMFLVYKADVAAGKNTIAGCEAALKNLAKAATLDVEKTQKEMLDKKTVKIKAALDSLKEKIKAENKAPATLGKKAVEKTALQKAPEKTPHSEKNAGLKSAQPKKHH